MPAIRFERPDLKSILRSLGLCLLLAFGYFGLESPSILHGLAPRPMLLLYGFEPFSRPPPPSNLLPAAPILFDEVTQFLPWHQFARRELVAGRVPLWNPYQFCGAPHLGALQPALFSPMTLLALPQSVLAPHAARLLGFLIAGLGAFLWLGALGLRPLACCFAALTFAFCGFLTLWAGHPHFLSAVWLPWLLLGIERLAVSVFQGVAISAAALAFSLLGGHGETSFHLALVAGVYALFRRPITIPAVLASGILGAALAAIAILPFFEYLLHSSAFAARQVGFELPKAIPWPALGSLLIPELWGGEPFGPFRLDRLNLNEIAGGFVGPVTVALALCARKSLLIRPALAVLVVCFLLAFEPPPLDRLAAGLPLLNLAYNGRLLLAVALMLSGLAAVGLQACWEGKAAPGLPFLGVGLACALLVYWQRDFLLPASLLVPVVSLLAGFLLLRALPSRGGRTAALLLAIVAVLPSLRLAQGYHGGAPVEGAWPRLDRGIAGLQASQRFAGFGMQAFPPQLATAYGLRDVRGYDAMTPRHYEELLARIEPWVTQTGRLGIFRLRALGRWHPSFYDFLGVRLLYLGRGQAPPPGALPQGGGFWLLPDSSGRARFTTQVRFMPDEAAILDYVASDSFDPDVPAILGSPPVESATPPVAPVPALATPQPTASASPPVPHPSQSQPIPGQPASSASPAAPASSRPQSGSAPTSPPVSGQSQTPLVLPGSPLPSLDQTPPTPASGAVASDQIPPTPASRAVTPDLASPASAPGVPPALSAGQAQPTPSGESSTLESSSSVTGSGQVSASENGDRQAAAVRFLKDDPGDVVLEVLASEPGYVVLADLDFPGWFAFLDGKPVQKFRANHAFRAVKVPSGRHLLRWSYRPDSYVLGAFVSSLSLWIVVSWIAFRWGMKPRRKPVREG